MTIQELDNELKKNILDGIYLFYGTETFLVDTYVKKVKKVFGGLILGINYIQIDSSNIEELISDIETPAFGFEKKLVIIKDIGIFKKTSKKENAKIKELKENIYTYFTDNIKQIIQYNIVVFIEEEIEKNDLYKLLEKDGKICAFETQTQSQIIARLKAIYNAYGVEINENSLGYLIESCGTSLQVLINESRKLIEYSGKGGKITNNDIDLLCTKEVDAVIFTLTDSLGKKDIKKALETLRNLTYNKEPIQKILITLYNHFKKIYLTKIAIENSEDISVILNLKPNQIFLVNKYRNQSKYFSKKELKNILDELILLDRNSKLGLIDINIGLESILSRYFS